MEYLNVIVAAAGAFGFGAFWYMRMSKPWIAASGVAVDAQGNPVNAGPMPFVVGIVAMLMVAGMMRHMLATSGIVSLGGGLVAGAGIGAFLISPWVAMNYAFAGRPAALTLIDGVNAVAGCAIMGLILTLF
jgi:hypothetical protein